MLLAPMERHFVEYTTRDQIPSPQSDTYVVRREFKIRPLGFEYPQSLELQRSARWASPNWL